MSSLDVIILDRMSSVGELSRAIGSLQEEADGQSAVIGSAWLNDI